MCLIHLAPSQAHDCIVLVIWGVGEPTAALSIRGAAIFK
ncbi:Unknown protein sequence [Pseudomonas amygdali pv. morsprunorum]|nr:Unknown protein sequence [Pseudomonas amygdali pv. morsprunorum]